MQSLQALLNKLKVECDEKGPLKPVRGAGRSLSRKSQIISEIPSGNIRFSDPDDAKKVYELCTDNMKKTFRINSYKDIIYLIENSVICITHLDSSGAIIGFISAREYPRIPSIHPSAWEDYIWTKYKSIELKARNTLWLHLLVWDIIYSKDLINSMLRTIFMHDPYVNYIAFIKTVKECAHLVPGASRAESSFRSVLSMERGVPGEKMPTLLIADRSAVTPRLKVRRAVEEDNDDILPFIEAHALHLRELYGDFYISELISSPMGERIILVCEHKELAVGVMILNTEINLEALEECFELSPFAGLRHLDGPPRKHRSKDWAGGDFTFNSGSDAMVGGDGESWFEGEGNSEDHKSKESKGAGSLTDQDIISIQDREVQDSGADTHRDLSMLYATERPLASASMLSYLDYLAEDEEEVEYDIVNIDPELLKLPDLSVVSAGTDNMAKNGLQYGNKENAGVQDILKPRREKKRSNTTSAKPPEYIIRYSGPSNAFLLEVFAMHGDYDERLSFDMLEAAFEMFSNRDYCIMCLPSKNCVFPLLEHFTLVAPHTTMNKRFINETLFVAHVNSVKGYGTLKMENDVFDSDQECAPPDILDIATKMTHDLLQDKSRKFDVNVRPSEPADLSVLSTLLEHAPRRDALADLIEKTLISKTLSSYMLLAEKQVIGVIVVGPLEEGTCIRNQFDLLPDSRQPGSDGIILGGVLSPALDPHGRWFLREVMRLSRFSTLFWICQPFAKGDHSARRNMMSLAERMVLVKPRKHLPNLSRDPSLDRLFGTNLYPFSLWMIEKPTSSLPMVYINNGIVVVGASRTGLSFIEALVLGPSARYLTFTNVTLISEHGIPTVFECLKAADICVPTEGRYTDTYLKSIPFCVYIDVIPAVVIEIDRKQKRVKLSTGGYKYYDDLVLTCGLQFQHPDYLRESLDRAKEVIKGKPCERILMDDPRYLPDRVPPPPKMPTNLFVINSLLQANMVLRRLLLMISENKKDLHADNPIIVYGDCVEAYSCVAALLELGVRPYEIGFIENFPPDEPTALRVNCFNDELIDERVQEKLQELGVRILRRFRLAKAYTHANSVSSLCLMDALHSVTLSCFALFYYGQKAIDIDSFKAINECGLVYDGGLIVDPVFQTNDPSIYGAGSCCNYARRLYATRWNHKHYNSEDVGEALAHLFLKKLDPFISMHPDFEDLDIPNIPRFDSFAYRRSHQSIIEVPASRLHLTQPLGSKWAPVMKFTSPIMKYATLPGPLYYLKVRKPGQEIPMEARLYLPHQGHSLVTDKSGCYFCLRLNCLHCVETITCLSKVPVQHETLIQLYGQHEAMFNKLLLRYKMEEIDDLYNYFKQPWMAALYQETFKELSDNINYQEVGALYETMRSKYAASSEIPAMRPSWSASMMSCFEMEECEEEQAKKLATFRSVIDKYLIKSCPEEKWSKTSVEESECGQNAAMRKEIGEFWEAISAERIVFQHLARHLAKYAVPNPQYAKANEFYYDETKLMEDDEPATDY